MFSIPKKELPEKFVPSQKDRTPNQWQKMSKKFRRKTFTPRLMRDLEKFPHPEFPNLDIWNGEGIFIYGPAGNGKTILAAQICEKIAEQLWVNYQSKKIIFASTPVIFKELKESYSDDKMESADVIEKYMTSWLLVLDDFGVQGKSSEWLLEQMYILINYRYEHLLPTIFTSNSPLPKLAEVLGDTRITSRIERMCKIAQKSLQNNNP